MREWTLTARVMRAWFVVALSAIAGMAIAAPLASAQAAEDEDAAPAQSETPAEGEGAAPDEAAPAPAEGEAAEAAPAESAPAEGEPAEAAPAEAAESAPAEAEGSTDDASALQAGDLEEEEAATSRDAAAEEAAAEQAQAQREPLPWRNTFFSWTHGVTPNSFFRDAQLSYNPNYYWLFNLAPRWYVDPSTFFFVSQSLFYELTDDDGSGAYNHDLALTDTIVELRRVQVWEGFIFIPAVRVVLPLSKASQAAQRYFGLGAGLTAVRVFPEVASLTIAAIGRYQYWFAGRNVPASMGTFPALPALPTLQPEGGLDNPALDQASPLTTGRHIITAGLNVTVTPVSGLTIGTGLFWQSQEGHGLADACTSVLTSADGGLCLPDQSDTHWRHFTSLSLSVAYDVAPWLNLSLSWANSTVLAPLFSDDGSVRGPFNPDNNISLSATLQLDAIYEALQGSEDDGLTPEQRQRRRQGLAGRESATGGSF